MDSIVSKSDTYKLNNIFGLHHVLTIVDFPIQTPFGFPK